MKFVTLSDLVQDIRKNLHKIPHNIDFVMGIPRSGMIAASIISEYLNAPLIDIDSFISGAKPTGGGRLQYHIGTGKDRKRVLVVDDTIFSGRSKKASTAKLAPFNSAYEFVYIVVYLEGPCTDVDVWLEDLRRFTNSFKEYVLYEWNIFHHGPKITGECIYDFDNVLCVEPPDERLGQPYIDYIKNATPLFLPTSKIGEIVSFRLEKYSDITKRWLDEYNVSYGGLTLFPAQSWDERSATRISPAAFKADIYRHRPWAKLFVESDDRQAREIYESTGKPVYCVDSNKMYAR